jgi:hypothetical protein
MYAEVNSTVVLFKTGGDEYNFPIGPLGKVRADEAKLKKEQKDWFPVLQPRNKTSTTNKILKKKCFNQHQYYVTRSLWNIGILTHIPFLIAWHPYFLFSLAFRPCQIIYLFLFNYCDKKCICSALLGLFVQLLGFFVQLR